MIPCTHFAVISSNRLVLPRRARVIVLIEVMEFVRGGVSCPIKFDTKSLFETIMLSRELSQAEKQKGALSTVFVSFLASISMPLALLPKFLASM